MTDKEPFSPQEWLDWQLKGLDGYKDLNKLNRLLISAEASISLNSERIEERAPLVAAGLINSDDSDRYQDTLEWALEVKALIEKEIADFPPLPVLPPSGPLQKISGVIEEVTFTKAMACFEAEAYSTMRDELERKRRSDNAGAAIVMVAQALSGTAPHALINDGKAKMLKCLYVKGKIGGKAFSGWFGMTNIRPGDFVEMAVVSSEEGYLAYAVANPVSRIISVTPKCNEGSSENSFSLSFLVFLGLLLIPFLFPFFLADAFFKTLICYIVSALLLSIGVFIKTQKERGSQYLLYEQLSLVLDLPKGIRSSLSIITARKIKEKIAAGTYTPRHKSITPVPQRATQGGLYEYFYYY
ncbi:putative type VI secretion system effector [Pantoea sp. SO10]|uniref:putative type VI secretion system effector n=1 Tax=Pantoea sp. SO10 TaxID=2575375 RepID=UPI0010C972F5|nr:putative type VI secretion system effector [Pantoea sp. SO10]QCP58812.1 hypothetical protein FCN45_05220 [Pantoea sp. SO10]